MRAQNTPKKKKNKTKNKKEATAEILFPLTPIALEERLSMKNK
jgi:hypothetical protein